MPNKKIEEFIRDVTAAVPRPKSEVRQRLNDILLRQKGEFRRAVEGKRYKKPRGFLQVSCNDALTDILKAIEKI